MFVFESRSFQWTTLMFLACACWQNLLGQASAGAIEVVAWEIPQGERCWRVEVSPERQIYCLKVHDHSILVFDEGFTPERRIGLIGNGPGEFLDPYDIAVSDIGLLLVADMGNERVQILGPDDQPLGAFPLKRPSSVTFLKNGEFAVHSRRRPSRALVFSAQGGLLAEVGEMTHPELPEGLRRAVNRGWVISDASGEGLYLFSHGAIPPLIRHYSRQGQLLRQWQVTDSRMDQNIEYARARLQERIEKGRIGTSRILNSLAYDTSNGLVWVGYPLARLRAYTPRGRSVGTLVIRDPQGRSLLPEDIDFIQHHTIVIASGNRLYAFGNPLSDGHAGRLMN